MKLYHGSPKKLKSLKPKQAKGQDDFENQKAVFLTKTFLHSALYAIGKNLKGKTTFAVSPRRLYIVGKPSLKSGYVYEVNVKAKKGPRQQYSYGEEIKNFNITIVFPEDYAKNIFYFENKGGILKKLK